MSSKRRRLSPPDDALQDFRHSHRNYPFQNTINHDYREASFSSERQSPIEQDDSIQKELRNITFGALSEAQESTTADLPSKSATSNEEKVQVLRQRLAELKRVKSNSVSTVQESKNSSKADDAHRTSKHAPTEQSSRRAVKRARPALEISKNPYKARDPRFSGISGQTDTERLRKNYEFLDEYRATELSNLKDAFKHIKDPEQKERLKREVNAAENRERAEREKRRHRNIAQEHKRKERLAIKDGKKPFFLKRSEQKNAAETERIQSMKAKEKDKFLQKRRKREGQKEKRNMPALSR